MNAFEYGRPRTIREAAGLLSTHWDAAAVLAGGTDLVSLMKDGGASPARVVSLKDVEGLRRLEFDPRRGLLIGAMVTLRELMSKNEVAEYYPALITAVEGVRSEQLRNMGTVGGELLQRPRCWYYRAGYGLLAMDHGRSLVPTGDNRYHAILGNSGPAYFVSPSSLAPILIALGARVRLEGARGSREIPVEKLFVIPKREGEREHSLRPNEVLTEIYVPPAAGAAMAVYEVRQKESLDWPLAAAAVALRLDGNKRVREARIVFGQVAPIPWRSPAAEAQLEGGEVSEAKASEAARAALRDAKPLSRNGYKIQLAQVALKRALLAAVKGEA